MTGAATAALLRRLQRGGDAVREAVARRREDDPQPGRPVPRAVPLRRGGRRRCWRRPRTVAPWRRADGSEPAERCRDVGRPTAADGPAGWPSTRAGLTALDEALLLVALAPDVDSRFEQFYGYLNDDVTRRRATVGLALRLCGLPEAAAPARVRLAAGAPLIDLALLRVEDPRPAGADPGAAGAGPGRRRTCSARTRREPLLAGLAEPAARRRAATAGRGALGRRARPRPVPAWCTCASRPAAARAALRWPRWPAPVSARAGRRPAPAGRRPALGASWPTAAGPRGAAHRRRARGRPGRGDEPWAVWDRLTAGRRAGAGVRVTRPGIRWTARGAAAGRRRRR